MSQRCLAAAAAAALFQNDPCSAFSTIAPVAYRPPQFKARHSSFLFKQPSSRTNPLAHPFYSKTKTVLHASSSSNKTKPPPLPNTEDPFLLLGMNTPTVDKKEIKRAYRKRAMQYHPDVICSTDSTAKERDVASKDFARINAAYEMLTGGNKGGAGADSSTSGGGAKTGSGGDNYQPPHRRTSSSSYSGKSTNWEDFMPNYDEEDSKYDADGDSFGSIFTDILTGAAGYAAGASGEGGGGFVGDLIDFLENNVDGFESGYDDDKLLTYGSFDEVASEMDETDILVTSLETKLSTVENELMQAQADLNGAVKFSEKLEFEERVAELKAREKVVRGYLKKGKKRLIQLRERYKELMVEGRGGRGYGGSSGASSRRSSGGDGGSSYSSNSGSGSSSRSSGPSSSYNNRAPETAPATTPPAPSPASTSSSSSSWKNEGFSSSYGRRSSSGRRGSRRGRATSVDEPSTASTSNEQSNQQQQRRANDNGYTSSSSRSSGNANSSSPNNSRSTTTSSTPQQYNQEPYVPPHRRTQSTADRNAQDKKRLRELKVDDDFEKLKRDMGM